MNRFLQLSCAIAALFYFSGVASAQFGYEKYTTLNGLEIAYKYGEAKDEEGKFRPALMLKVKNTNDYAAEYTYSLDFYNEGILRETSGTITECVPPRSTRMGKLNGTYYLITQFSLEQVQQKAVKLEINELEINRVEECPEEETE